MFYVRSFTFKIKTLTKILFFLILIKFSFAMDDVPEDIIEEKNVSKNTLGQVNYNKAKSNKVISITPLQLEQVNLQEVSPINKTKEVFPIRISKKSNGFLSLASNEKVDTQEKKQSPSLDVNSFNNLDSAVENYNKNIIPAASINRPSAEAVNSV